MKNSIHEIKKYSFFEILHEFSEISTLNKKVYSLSEISVNEIKHYSPNLFLSCKIKKASHTKEYTNEPTIFKLYNDCIINEYNNIYNKTIYSFFIREIKNCQFMYLLGSDFREVTIGNDKTFLLVYSLKIILINQIDDEKTNIIQIINLMKYTNIDNKIYQGNDFIRNIEPILNITCFTVSENGCYAAIGLEKGEIILIADIGKENSRNLNNISLLTKATLDNITNVCFCVLPNKNIVLYASTLSEIYYYLINDKKYKELKVGWGALSGSFVVDNPLNNKVYFLSPSNFSISEYDNFEKGSSWLFEGKKNNLGTYKNNFYFLTNQNTTLEIYDKLNKFFIYSNTFHDKRIISITKDEKNHMIYCLCDNSSIEGKTKREIFILKEIKSQEKLDQFYKNKDFLTAISYSKSFPHLYSKFSMCESFKAYGDYLYSKGDYKNAINEYNKTVKFIQPSFIIQLFLDGSKMNYLISYLQVLVKEFLISTPDTFNYPLPKEKKKEFIQLLLNCYIKQKKFTKLKEFVENAYINRQESIAKYAIDICKETKQNELAFSIAKNGKMNDLLIELLIEDKKDYMSALDILQKEKRILTQFDLLLKFGNIFLQNCPEAFMLTLKEIVLHFIHIKNNKEVIVSKEKSLNETVKKIAYEQMLTIFNNEENEKNFENFVDFILENDKKCSSQIIHRKIEILLKKCINEQNLQKKSKYSEELISILKIKKIQSKIDKNYLLLLFKTHNFTEGTILISEITEQRIELLEIYKETKNYEKIFQICNTYGDTDNNIYIQSLNYFIEIYDKNDKDAQLIEKYITNILTIIAQKNIMSSILILEIAKKMKHKLKFNILKEFILNMLKNKQVALENDKKEKDYKFDKLGSIKEEIEELQKKKVILLHQKCNLCNKEIKNQNYVCFVCQHTFHQKCLMNANINKDIDELECTKCKNKNNTLTQRMRQSEEQSSDHNNFFMELKSKQKKFELIAKYLGKGMIKLDD